MSELLHWTRNTWLFVYHAGWLDVSQIKSDIFFPIELIPMMLTQEKFIIWHTSHKYEDYKSNKSNSTAKTKVNNPNQANNTGEQSQSSSIPVLSNPNIKITKVIGVTQGGNPESKPHINIPLKIPAKSNLTKNTKYLKKNPFSSETFALTEISVSDTNVQRFQLQDAAVSSS